jgi:predicted acylesterase/phospholipase RssA
MFTERDSGRLEARRKRQCWPSDRPFKILSLDGGGIRGLFSSKVVEELAHWLRPKAPVQDYFDLIAGTSTGGIVAIGLGLGLAPNRISALYEVKGREIFPPFWSRSKVLRFLRRLRTSLYDHAALERALREEFGSRSFGESTTRLVIPAFVGPHAQVAVFKTDHHPDYRRDWRSPAWEVARATSAAPTFFEGHRYNSDFFLDGGLWANNPIICAIVEAISSYDVRLDQILVLSIGTGNPQPELKPSAVRAGMVGWRDILTTSMYLTTDSALSQARLLLGWDQVVRIAPSAAVGSLELDDWSNAVRLLPSDAAEQVAFDIEQLRVFFEQPALQRERHYSTHSLSATTPVEE